MSREIGENLRRHRMTAGITQETLAHAAGLAPSTVAKLEQGGNVRIETLHKIARALHIKTSQLMASDTPDPVIEDSARLRLVELRNVLTPPIGLTDPEYQRSEEPDLPTLLRVVRNGSAAYHKLSFGTLAKSLPKLIRDADSAVCYFDSGDEHNRALGVRAEAYLLGGKYLSMVRQYDLAYHALSGAIHDARSIDDTNTAAYAVAMMSYLLLRQGRLDEAEQVAVKAADHVEPRISAAEPERLVVWGWLALAASASAVRNNRDGEASEAARIAASAASALGSMAPGVQRFAGFDSTVVGMKTLEEELIRPNSDPYRVIEDSTGKAPLSDRGLRTVTGISGTDKNRHRLTVASAYVEVREFDDAFERLVTIEGHQGAEWLRHQKGARDVMEKIARRRKRKLTVEQRRMMKLLAVAA
jgi:transcriptional regulator with XRE-family HTH domain